MGKLGYIFAKCWAYGMAICPFWLIYLRSDLYYLIVYHVVRYRRKTVRQNLLRSFPEKPSKEIKTIERHFYRNLCDVVVETAKLFLMKPDDLKKRIAFTNPEMIMDLYKEDKNIFLAFPHSGNWEWFGKLMHTLSPHSDVAVYKKLKDPYFERFMYDLRIGYHIPNQEMVESSYVLQSLLRRRDLLNRVLIVADQTSYGRETDYWNIFMHQETCWFFGLERMAVKLDYAVVFVAMRRTGRGRYEVTFHLITDAPKTTEKGFIMEQYSQHIECFINGQPDNWLWSHRRWKHSRKQEVA